MKHRISLGAAGVLALGVIAAGGVAVAASPSTAPTAASSPTTTGSSSSGSSGSSGSSTGKDLVLPAGGVLATRTTKFCERSDKIVERLTERAAKLDDKGTAAKLAAAKAKNEKRVAKLRDHNYDKRADAVQKRIDRRSERVTKLPDRLANVKAAAQECDSLGIS